MKAKCAGILFLLVSLIVFAREGAVFAAEPGSHSGTYRKSVIDPESVAPFSMDAYSVRGTTIDLQYILSESIPATVSGSGRVSMTCTGGADHGGWTFTIQPGSTCWNAFSLPCPGAGCGTLIPARAMGLGDIKVAPVSLCTGAARGTPSEKEYCVFGSGITGDTQDDMFSVAPGATGYLEYVRRGGIDTPQRLNHISRAGTGGRSLMLPSGPLGSFTDYDSFLGSPPVGEGITIRDACYAMAVTVCEDARPAIPFGECGVASGQAGDAYKEYFLAAGNIPAASLCRSGMPSSVQDRGGYFTWRCSNGDGYESAECRAGKAVAPQCGPAHNQVYQAKEHIIASSLCAEGTPSAIAGEGPWTWSCSASVGGGAAQNCTALRSADACESNVGDVVYILDDSNSMRSHSKLARARNAMTRSFELLVEKKSRQSPDSAKICVTGMQQRAFVRYVDVRGCRQLRAYARKSCGVPVAQGGNEQELSVAEKNGLCANYWNGVFHSAADADPSVKAQILTKGRAAISSFTDTDLSTPLYRRVMQATRYMGSGVAGKPNKVIVVTDGNDVGWETDGDVLNFMRSYSNVRVYILHIVNTRAQLNSSPKKNVVSITNATNGFYAKVLTDDTDGFQRLMNKAVMGCEVPHMP